MELIENDMILDGESIQNEYDFHSMMSVLLDFGPYYGRNLDALWDRLSNDVERPVNIIWLNSELSRLRLGDTFNKIIVIFERVKEQDIEYNFDDKFNYVLK